MTVLLDTSVLVAAFTPDLHSAKAEQWLGLREAFRVSDWAAAEFSAAIRNKVRQGVVRVDKVSDVEAAFDNWVARLGGLHGVSPNDHLLARALVTRHENLRAPDALHIAIAIRLDCALATLDRGQAKAAAVEGLDIVTP